MSFLKKIDNLSRQSKRLILLGVDFLMIPMALWSAFYLRLGEVFPNDISPLAWWLFPIAPLASIPVFIKLGLYRAILRYSGTQVLTTIAYGSILSALILAFAALMLGPIGLPRSAFIIYWLLCMLYVGGSRFALRGLLDYLDRQSHPGETVIIYGAGQAGAQLAGILLKGNEYKPLAFVDNNKHLHGSKLNGLPIYSPNRLAEILEKHAVDEIFLAIPSLDRSAKKRILNNLESHHVYVRTVPSLEDIVTGKANLGDIRDIDIEDLLGRDAVAPNTNLFEACINDKVVLVTGAGGSIGSELCRQIAGLKPKKLILFEHSEYALYKIHQELLASNHTDLLPLLGNVQDYDYFHHVLQSEGVQTIYHAAAYKHVPMVEHNIGEGIKNNIFGTLNIAEAAIEAEVETVILISTDKAVRPTNIMGTTKRFAEMILQALAAEGGIVHTQGGVASGTRLAMVRFGNVLGSSGSVIPLFKSQIKNGGPLTVTHPDIIRYFMTIQEAAQLVIQAGSMAEGGDVFVLDMGEPVKIDDLARKMIHLMGYEVKEKKNPHGDIAIDYVGLRPGEKLFEELLIGENISGTEHQKIFRAIEHRRSAAEMRDFLSQLTQGLETWDEQVLVNTLADCVVEYQAVHSTSAQ